MLSFAQQPRLQESYELDENLGGCHCRRLGATSPLYYDQLSQADQRENAQRESAYAISAKLSGEEKMEFDKKEEARR